MDSGLEYTNQSSMAIICPQSGSRLSRLLLLRIRRHLSYNYYMQTYNKNQHNIFHGEFTHEPLQTMGISRFHSATAEYNIQIPWPMSSILIAYYDSNLIKAAPIRFSGDNIPLILAATVVTLTVASISDLPIFLSSNSLH